MFLKVCSRDFQGRFQWRCACHAVNTVCNSTDPRPVKHGITQIYKIHLSCNTFREACKTLQFVSEMPKNNFGLPNHCCICSKRAFPRQLGKPSVVLLLAQTASGGRAPSPRQLPARGAGSGRVCGSPGPRAGRGCALPRQLSMEILIALRDHTR